MAPTQISRISAHHTFSLQRNFSLSQASSAIAMAIVAAKLGFRSPPPSSILSPQIFPVTNTLKLPTFFHIRTRKLLHDKAPSAVVNERQQQGELVPFTEPETLLIDALLGIQGRGRSASPQQIKDVESAVQVLEAEKGVADPTSSGLIEGRWQLIFTTRPGTASPIQRTFVGVDFFNVFQEVYLRTDDPRVSNIVQFSEAIGELKVEAAASIKDGTRILFRFDKAAFSFKFLPFKVPYPVPFRLLGDEAKGWLDTTYLSPSGNIRISRGNKGTTFVLQKETDPRQKLLSAISTGARVKEAIDEFIAQNQTINEGETELAVGEWQLIWSSQMETDSWIENAANGLMGKQIVRENGRLKILVDILLGIRFSMDGTFVKSGSKTYDVTMDDAAILAGPFGLPMEMISKFNIELLYADEKIRITRGYSKIVFVHLRV